MQVREVMTDQVQCCAPDTSLAAVIEIMWNNDCGVLPVVEDGKLAGIVTDRDICIALGTRGCAAQDLTAHDVSTGTVSTCAPEDDVYSVLDTMQTSRVRRIPVVDRLGTVLGIVTLSDLVHCADRKVNRALHDLVLDTIKAIGGRMTHKPAARQESRIRVAVAS